MILLNPQKLRETLVYTSPGLDFIPIQFSTGKGPLREWPLSIQRLQEGLVEMHFLLAIIAFIALVAINVGFKSIRASTIRRTALCVLCGVVRERPARTNGRPLLTTSRASRRETPRSSSSQSRRLSSSTENIGTHSHIALYVTHPIFDRLDK
ncbi:hypothetical protein JQ616_13445 [Bradyrhizobium tropiciagri]|uniref:hypothetical protein n=1 Tax=Bradyrhizobium tropiciagri TaxID=312253 RepID=UPI001BA4DB24|nr:hypothetical protein [Bradyrhizobium tropiciagri]MBR0895961.1 hypothetical protein [Bradyrhizobium tropiciagri]